MNVFNVISINNNILDYIWSDVFLMGEKWLTKQLKDGEQKYYIDCSFYEY